MSVVCATVSIAIHGLTNVTFAIVIDSAVALGSEEKAIAVTCSGDASDCLGYQNVMPSTLASIVNVMNGPAV